DTFFVMDLLRRGEVAMLFFVCEPGFFQALDLPPEILGVWPVPPFERGREPAMLAHYHFKALNASLAGEENRKKRLKAWKILSTLNGSRGARWFTEMQVKAGLARFLDPDVLKRFDMEEYLDEVPLSWRKAWKEALSYSRTEPPEGFWEPIKVKVLNNDVLSLALTREDFDWRASLQKAEHDANTGLMFKRTDEEMRRYRPWGWGGVVLLGAVVFFLGVKMWQALRRKAARGDVLRRAGPLRIAWTPLLLMAPAIVLIAVWKYYPLVRGSVMAFQDYRITGHSSWVGVDNFINVMLNKDFWMSLRQTFKYVVFCIALGFFTPVALALLLSEVPRWKTAFRTIFFLPQISSGLVIMFLWKVLLYNPTEHGLLNKLLWFADPVDWLGDQRFTMMAVILPGVWAGAGMGSLIYLAALKSIPNETYEAVEVDGGGMWQKVRHVTLPALLPLLVINFVGAFIGTFHAMGNIFAMTAGGPGNETMVMGLMIWYEAFAFLRYGTATAMAWILGSMLIGFTLMQLKILSRVEFRRAAID
ncbi:MAG: carbohydrate ABC transporter permease, partial [Planctomycetota bacterium]